MVGPSVRSGLSMGLLSTYPPTQCGLATFNAALWQHLAGSGHASVVRVVDRPETHPGPEVVAHLVNGCAASATAAVDVLNSHDVVLVQHEYGIYGGPDGEDVVALLAALTVPAIVVLHTVLQEPSAHQRWVLERIVASADVLVTMTEAGRQRLLTQYDVHPSRAVVIPHGAVGPGALGVRGQVTRRPVILTWGLLGPGKGIEWVIDALPGLRDLSPRYVVLGKTHPKVQDQAGEAYRDSLVRRAARHGVLDLVELDDRYLTTAELAHTIDAAAVVLLPYDSREQVTSGVLVEAVAAGRPVVSTAFPHAVELLGDGLGLVVPQRDPAATEHALRRVLTEPGLAADMSARAVRKAPELLWGAVAQRYRTLAEDLVSAELATAS
ncbi:MAG: glycosyl transferase group 1 [Frankiales bacterium]|nr:glycosyl transferase group 1 [Frankiales bacterium]